VRIRSGPATVSAEERSEYATGEATRWEGSFNPKKREPGDLAEFTSIRIGLEGKVDNDSGIRPNLRFVCGIGRGIFSPVRLGRGETRPAGLCSTRIVFRHDGNSLSGPTHGQELMISDA
jgi:hypothetical protein